MFYVAWNSIISLCLVRLVLGIKRNICLQGRREGCQPLEISDMSYSHYKLLFFVVYRLGFFSLIKENNKNKQTGTISK